MLVHAAYCVDITLDRNFQNPFSATRNDTIDPLVPKNIPIYGYIYDVKNGRLVEVNGATKAGKAAT